MCAQHNNSNSIYTDITNAYWNDICDSEPLSLEDQTRLINLIKAGDTYARDTLVESFLRLVVSRAKIYCHDYDSFMDMVQEGNLGLIMAVERFDPEKGCRFSTYATHWIDRYIMRESYRTGKPTRLPEHLKTDINRLSNAEALFAQENNRYPTSSELAKMLNMSVERIEQLQSVLNSPLSLNAPVNATSTDSNPLSAAIPDTDALSPEESVCAKATKEILVQLMEQTLTETEYLILKLRFGFDGPPHTLLAISERVGLTKEGVRKIENRAANKLQKALLKCGLTQADFI